MSRDGIRCITIVHPPNEIKEYRWLSAFFRLIGIWVCENVEEEHGDQTDFTIRIRYEDNFVSDWQRISCGSQGEWKECSPRPELAYAEEHWLSEILEQMQDCFKENTWKEIKEIARCFYDHDLMRGSYAVGYFGDADDPRIFAYMGRARQRFFDAYQELVELEKDDSSKYLLAAICNCQRRINELYTVIWKALKSGKIDDGGNIRETLKKYPFIPYDEINVRLSKILEMDPKNYAAYAIRGFVKQLDDDKVLEFVYDFENAVALCGRRSYASCLLYHIGKYFEVVRADKAFEEKYYSYAYEVNPYNYRAAYKVAMCHRRRGEHDKAMEILKEILNILSTKTVQEMFQPVECAYLYKTNSVIGKMYIRKEKYRESIRYLEQAKECGSSDKNMLFYQWMFGEEDGAIFKKAAVKKLNIYNCQMDLADSYAMLDSYEGILRAYS